MIANPHDSDYSLLDAIFLDGRPVEGLSSQELIPWFNQPHIQSAITQLKSISDTILALRHARARFAAIESLDTLCQSAPNPTDRLKASIALLKPLPEGGVGLGPPAFNPEGVQASSRGQSEESPTSAAHGSNRAHSLDPERVEPAEVHANSASQISDLRFEIPPAQNPITPAAFQNPPPASTHSLLDLLQSLEYDDSDVDADFDDAEDPDAAQDAAEDAAADRHAAAIEAHLGVPITHPEILKAISELRIHDLDAIAAKIRAESNGSSSPSDPRATGPDQEANLNGHSRSPPR